ncbi:MAG: dTDP-4-dehydrorhamnose reductase [Planctomycetaceae bacterium]
MARIAIVGAAGQLGTALRRHAAFSDDETIALDRSSIDVVDPDAVMEVLNATRPELVINAAAYNLVDRAEDEPHVAYAVNALGPRNLARWCEAQDAVLLHVSTDYVFCGTANRIARNEPYGEEDAPRPVSAYGVSKLAGEYFVRSLCRRHFVVRTCGLYGHTGGAKGNFVETMLRLGRERSELRIVDDQHCTPTSVADLADVLTALVKTDAHGLYHATSAGQTTWFRFACEIFRQSRMTIDVQPITSAEFGAKAQRPTYSVLDCGRLTRQLGRPLATWQDALARYLKQRPAG